MSDKLKGGSGKLQNDSFSEPAIFNAHPDANSRGTDGIFKGEVAKYPGKDGSRSKDVGP